MTDPQPLIVAGAERSGNTWLLRLLSDLLRAPIKDDDRWCRDCDGGWMLFKVHMETDGHDGPIVGIVRDPRDIVVSRLYVRTNMPGSQRAKLNTLISQLKIPDKRGRTYIEIIQEWQQKGIPIIRYRDLKNDGPATLAQVATELTGETFTEKQAAETFDRITFERCKETDPHFVRKGIVGDWQSHFNPVHRKRITRVAGEHMLEFGFIDSLDWYLEMA